MRWGPGPDPGPRFLGAAVIWSRARGNYPSHLLGRIPSTGRTPRPCFSVLLMTNRNVTAAALRCSIDPTE